MKQYIIGIDTGGTFTDAVLVEQESGKVIETAKEITTHHNLAIGTGRALASLLSKSSISAGQIGGVTVSTTLATNSVVENKGARVAIIVIGYVKHFKLPVKAVVFVKGGHTIKGEEEQPLEIDYLVTLLEGLKNEVDAFGVCSAMSMINPSHELVTEKAISMIAPKPTFCSHRISQQAGMEERAATAGLHAKLMPIMEDFVAGVSCAMEEQDLTCPMIIVSGNGKPVDKEFAVKNAGVTVASGPACTATFGAISARQDSLVIDVGGTTTDITMLENGKLVLDDEGCRIGQWRTHVEAVNMFTGGIGGDSHVIVNDDLTLTIGPNRVLPFARSQNLPPLKDWLGTDTRSKTIQIVEGGTCTVQKNNEVFSLLQQHKSLTPAQLREMTGLGGIPLQTILDDLGRKQLLTETGFTPTDALHVLGRLEFGDREKAIEAAKFLAALRNQNPEDFCQDVLNQTEGIIENMIIDYVIQRYWGNSLTNFISRKNDHPVLKVQFSLRIPLIGIGAAARQLLPNVAKKLGTSITFPENCEVGNAIGAALVGMQQMKEN
jgi:N-methylhydantoinase A/oxoprolinase/acetone carboxylase beta subunit